MEKLNKKEQEILLGIAKKSVESFISTGIVIDFDLREPALCRKRGVFVTISKFKSLRGCIGRISANRELWKTVRDMAVAAAVHDYRFDPVRTEELKDLDYEISVLSEPEKIKDWKSIELGRHGVIISQGNRSGVYLPQVATETGWTLEEFLQSLCVEKAGIDKYAYKNDQETIIEIFEVQSFRA